MEKKTIGLQDVLTNYGVPDPKIVGKLPKGGIQLDFVGHADVTKMLIEIDPMWTWEPVAFDADGLPAYRVENGMAHMAGWMTVHGVRRLGVGSVAHNKPDLLKELCSDYIRNAAMRFGICLGLWTKQEWEDIPSHTPAPAPKAAKPAPKAPAPEVPQVEQETDGTLSSDQVSQFFIACATKKIDPKKVASLAGVQDLDNIKATDLARLRVAFKELQNSAK
jgi:hypothetical protein